MEKKVEKIGQKSLKKITIGNSIFIMSYATIVAATHRGRDYVTNKKYSSTTSSHISYMGYKGAKPVSPDFLSSLYEVTDRKYYQSQK